MPAAHGAIILVRHGEPALSRKVRLSAAEYAGWWARYEIGGLKEGQSPPPELIETAAKAGVIIASTRRRALETARALIGERDLIESALYIEAPLPPPAWPAWLKLSPKAWGTIARFWWWFFNHHQGQETRAQASVRAHEAADQLTAFAASGQDVLLVAHGFFNVMIARDLRGRGWRRTENEGFSYWASYWAAKRFEKG